MATTQGPKELARIVASLELRIEAHPMCLRLEKLPGVYRVIYPAGDFPTNGAQARHTCGGKIVALNRLHAAIEKVWVESYPT